MTEKSPLEQRIETKNRLDRAMETGALTIGELRTIPPTATSIEHHISLMNALKAQERIKAQAATVEAIAFLATRNSLKELLYEESQAVSA